MTLDQTPRPQRAALLLLGTFAMMAGTGLLGWWAVPLLGLLMGLKTRALDAALAAGAAWFLLLMWDALAGPLWPYSVRLGGVFGLPGWGMLLVTGLFAALLAWSAATLLSSLRRGGH